MGRRRLGSLALSLGLLALGAAPATAQAPASLEGETLQSNGGSASFSCSAGGGPGGTGTASFSVSGEAAGPYPGTFTAQGTITGSADGSTIDVAETFTISSPAGEVSGSKQATGIPASSLGCSGGDIFFANAQQVPYKATIKTAGGSYSDSGSSELEFRVVQGFPIFRQHFTASNGVVPAAPTSKEQCKNGGWRNYPQFKNQGQCVSYVQSQGKKPKA